MTLLIMPMMLLKEGAGPERFYVYDGERKVGRIFKGHKDIWWWAIDWFAIGQNLLAKPAAGQRRATTFQYTQRADDEQRPAQTVEKSFHMGLPQTHTRETICIRYPVAHVRIQ